MFRDCPRTITEGSKLGKCGKESPSQDHGARSPKPYLGEVMSKILNPIATANGIKKLRTGEALTEKALRVRGGAPRDAGGAGDRGAGGSGEEARCAVKN